MKIMNTMSKPLMTAMLISAGLFSQAQAQTSNVTMYGYLDIGLVKESAGTTQLSKGYNNWLGFRGNEDLGGGLSAIFDLQMRFNPDTGIQERSTTLFQGETTVGLKSISMGTIRLGRALTPLWAQKWTYDPWYDSGFMGSLAYYNGDFDSDGLPTVDYHNYARTGNTIFFSSPSTAGIQGHVSAEVELALGAKTRSKGGSLNYANDFMTAMLSYEKNHVENDIIYLAGSYKIDLLNIMGSYSKTKFALESVEITSMMLAGTYAIGANSIRVGVGRIKENGNQKITLGYNHPLSKRTNLYTDIYREKTTKKINGIALGMNHTF
jgi:predicted porin